MTSTRILVPTDFSENSEHALLYGASLAERFGATVHLVHVVTLYEHQGEADDDFPNLQPYLDRADAAARAALDAGADHGGAAETVVNKVLLRGINAYEAIVDHAERETVDLIVMATHGRTGLRHAVLGSVTERVVRFAPCPVLVVEKGDHDFVDPETMAVDIQRVVFAMNLDEGREKSFERAVELLRPYAPQVHLVHAVEAEVPALYTLAGIRSVFQMHPELKGKLAKVLEERAGRYVPAEWPLKAEVREGKPQRVVGAYATEIEADLIVVAGETRIDFEERVLGGTAERIVRRAPCPTLVV